MLFRFGPCSGSRDEGLTAMIMYFYCFSYNLHLESSVALRLNKLESPLSKDALFKVWLKLREGQEHEHF